MEAPRSSKRLMRVLHFFRLLTLCGFITTFFGTALPASAAVTVMFGQVIDQDSNALEGVQIDCLTGENNLGPSTIATSDSSGAYSCDIPGDSLADNTPISIQPKSFEGYRSAESQNFNWTGEAQEHDFQYQIAPKTITVSVKYEDEELVSHVQVTAQPINLEVGESAMQVQEDFAGEGNLNVTGGDWIVKADANFSEINADTYPWISVTPPIKVSFTDDNSVENTDLVFYVARSAQKVTVTLLDASGNPLNNGNVGDAYFEGFNGTYGSVSTSRKVNPSSGVSALYLLPGVWKVSALDTQLVGQSFDPEEATFVIPDTAGTIDLGTIQARENIGVLSGTVTIDSELQSNVEVVALNSDNGARLVALTNENGEFSITQAPYGTYALTLSGDAYIPTLTASATLTTDDDTQTGLIIEAKSVDTTIHGFIKDSDANVLENIPGTIRVTYGDVLFTAPVQPDGSYQVNMYSSASSENTAKLSFVPQPNAEFFAPDTLSISVTPNSTIESTLALSSDEATISGNITDFEGNDLDTELGEQPTLMAIQNDTGAVETVDIETDGSFEIMVGPGTWTLVPQINDPEATVLPQNTSGISIEVTAGSTPNIDVPMLEKVGVAEITITDPEGAPVAEAPVVFTNLPALQEAAFAEGGSVDQNRVVQIAATADANGVVSVSLPEGDFTAYVGTNPNVDEFIKPMALEFTINAGDAVELSSAYEEPASMISGNIGSGFASASITFSETEGGSTTFAVDEDGNYSGALAPGTWTAVASGVKDGEVYVREKTITVESGENTLHPAMTNTHVQFPSATTVTGSAEEPLIVSNTEGASVSIPAYAAGFSGDIIATLQPIITFGDTGDMNQVGLSYEVTLTDNTGAPIKTLNSPVTVTLPLDENFTENVSTDEITGSYYQPDLQTFLNDGMVASANDSSLIIQTKHLSRFAITAVDDGTPNKPKGLKSKRIKKHQALLDWKDSDGATQYVLQVRKKGIKNKAKWRKFEIATKSQRKVKKLKADTNYQFRVKACSAEDKCSTFTKWKKFKTK